MEWLKNAVQAAGGARKVAKAAGLSRPTVDNILAGRRRLNSSNVAKLRPALPLVADEQWFAALISEEGVSHAEP